MTITSRIDAITRIPPAYRAASPPAPRSVKIELTALRSAHLAKDVRGTACERCVAWS